MTESVDRTVKLARENKLRLAIKRLVRAATACDVTVTVDREDLELLLTVIAERKT